MTIGLFVDRPLENANREPVLTLNATGREKENATLGPEASRLRSKCSTNCVTSSGTVAKTQELLRDDPLWLYLKDRLAEPVALEPTVVCDKPRRS